MNNTTLTVQKQEVKQLVNEATDLANDRYVSFKFEGSRTYSSFGHGVICISGTVEIRGVLRHYWAEFDLSESLHMNIFGIANSNHFRNVYTNGETGKSVYEDAKAKAREMFKI